MWNIRHMSQAIILLTFSIVINSKASNIGFEHADAAFDATRLIHLNPIVMLIPLEVDDQKNIIQQKSVEAFDLLNLNNRILTNFACTKFPNATAIKADALGVQELSNDALHGCQKLKSFNVQSNEISKLPSGFFKHTPELETIDMRGNNLIDLNMTDLSDLKMLGHLFLAKNSLKKFLMSNTTSALNHLVELELQENQLADLDVNEIKIKFPNLQRIQLCPGNKFHPETLKKIVSLLRRHKVEFDENDCNLKDH